MHIKDSLITYDYFDSIYIADKKGKGKNEIHHCLVMLCDVVRALSLPNQGCHPLSSSNIISSSSRAHVETRVCSCYLFCSAVLFLYATRRQRLITPPSPFSSLYCAPTYFHSPQLGVIYFCHHSGLGRSPIRQHQ